MKATISPAAGAKSAWIDRKSTRLNSSHLVISYAVFCLEKQEKQKIGLQHIVVATDFSAESKRALAHAVTLARRYGAELSLVHAIRPEPREPLPLDPTPRELDRRRLEAEQKMKQLDKESRLQDLRHHSLLQSGSVWDLLHSILEHDDIDLLVLGTHGRGGLKKLALGSIAEEVLRLAPFPVLTVGPNAVAPKSDEIGRASCRERV